MMRPEAKTIFSDQRGASAVEFALLVPILLAVLLGTITLFDLFRNLQNVDKATFTVGDMLSRQTQINQPMLDSMLLLMQNMVTTAGDGGLRVTSVSRKNDTMILDWTAKAGAGIPDRPVSGDIIPDIAEGDSVIITESFVPHRAFVAGFGIDTMTFTAQAAHRPRFIRAIVWRR